MNAYCCGAERRLTMSLKVSSIAVEVYMILCNSIVKMEIKRCFHDVSCSFLNVVVCVADILKI